MPSQDKFKYTNHLIKERSPYLRQHAHNPVDWYPWGEEAFQKAKKENKPILLSIGYSACHWCHVMAHESFENDSIAALMNGYFVCIKVDREEHPDMDHLYQAFVQATTGRGGWPLTVFLTPDLVPFYGGTYFPARARYGMISFPELLQRIHELYTNEPEKIIRSAAEISTFLKQLDQATPGKRIPAAPEVANRLFQRLASTFDPREGGFGPAPKFPHPADLDFLLQYYFFTGDAQARQMALFTLRKMAAGGIYDQLGGGFHRYATDEQWLVPHFEKMLYDNALLIPLYLNAYRLSGESFYRRIAEETADFVLRELHDTRGAFHASLDADSEGQEGKFYLWDFQEIQQALGGELTALFADYYGASPRGNFEGRNILHLATSVDALASRYRLPETTVRNRLSTAKKHLLELRSRRVPPARDDKILTDWNGMMISALFQLYQLNGKTIYRRAAEEALRYLEQHQQASDGTLYHFVISEQKKIPAYLDDYAYLIQALLDGYEATGQLAYLDKALKLTHQALSLFFDPHSGGFYYTSLDSRTPFTRLRQPFDSAAPAGNSIMIRNLLRLHFYTGDRELLTRSEQTFRLYQNDFEQRPSALSALVSALLFYHYGPVEITMAAPNATELRHLRQALSRLFLPARLLVSRLNGQKLPLLEAGLWENRGEQDQAALFVCFRRTCSLPLNDLEGVKQTLKDFGLFYE